MQLSDWLRSRFWRARDWGVCAVELAGELKAAPPSPELARMAYELAAACEEIVPDRERAVELYLIAWKAAHDNPHALGRARVLCRELGKTELIAKIAELEFRASKHPAHRAIQGLAWLDAGDPDRAIRPLLEAMRAQPDDVVLREALATAQREWGDARAEVERLEAAALEQSDRKVVARLLLQAARVQGMIDASSTRYRELLEAAFDRDPNDDGAYTLLERLFERGGDWESLMELYGLRAGAAPTDADLVEAYRRGGVHLWLSGSQPAFGARLVLKALLLAYNRELAGVRGHVAMFTLLREHFDRTRTQRKLLKLIDQALASPLTEDEQVFFCTLGLDCAWAGMRDATAAYPYALRLEALVPDHPLLEEYAREGGLDQGRLAAEAQAAWLEDADEILAEPAPAPEAVPEPVPVREPEPEPAPRQRPPRPASRTHDGLGPIVRPAPAPAPAPVAAPRLPKLPKLPPLPKPGPAPPSPLPPHGELVRREAEHLDDKRAQRLALAARALALADKRRDEKAAQVAEESGKIRVAPRVPLHVDVSVNLQASVDVSVGSRRATGVTRDISTHGLFVAIDDPPAAGTELSLSLTLPGDDDWSVITHELRARVVRVEPGEGFGAELIDPPAAFRAEIERLGTQGGS